MNETEAEKRLSQLRACIMRIMAEMTLVDLSAHSQEAAWGEIKLLSDRVANRSFPADVVREAAKRVAICLDHYPIGNCAGNVCGIGERTS